MTAPDKFRLGYELFPDWWVDKVASGEAQVYRDANFDPSHAVINTDDGFIRVAAGEYIARDASGRIYLTGK